MQATNIGLEVETFQYQPDGRWSVDPLPALDSSNTLVLAFGAPRFASEPEPLRRLLAEYPTSCVAGCSTAGEIAGTQLLDDSVSVAVARFRHTRLARAVASVGSPADSYAAGEQIGRQLAHSTLRGVLVFSDGLRVNGTELVRGLSAALPPSVVITGGLAGDGERFQRTWVISDGAIVEGVVTAVGLYGERVRIGHGSKGGWDAFGPERIITRSDGNVLYELDGKPALALYKEYLGDRASGLPATALLFPLTLRRDRSDPKSLVRTVLSVDEANQSMTFAGDVPQGYRAQLMRANFDRLIEAAGESARMTRLSSCADGSVLAIAISCVGRRLVLGERTEEELENALAALPPRSQLVGFYSYGEISPFAAGTCDFHNQTMTLTTLAEA